MKMLTFESGAGGIFLNGFIERSKKKVYSLIIYKK